MKYSNTLNNSYTWNKEYSLPYESRWSKMIKFCYLNGMSWSDFKKDARIKTLIGYNINYDVNLEGTPHTVLSNASLKYKFCPKCMKYAYHSQIHQSELLYNCFLHPNVRLEIVADDDEINSKDGKYAFFDVKTEDIIKNQPFRTLINNYIEMRKKEAPIFMDIIWGNKRYDKNGKINYYNSTKQIAQNYFYLQNQGEMSNVKQILKVNTDDIEKANKAILDEIIYCTAKYNQEEMHKYFLEEYSLEICIEKSRELILKNNSTIPWEMTNHGIGWIFFKHMRDVIEEYFDGEDEFYRTAREFSSFTKELDIQNSYNYAIIMTLYCITGTTAPEGFRRTDSSMWTRGYSKCNYAINIKNELWNYSISRNYRLTMATSFIINIIIKDCFWYIVNDLNQKLLTEKLNAQKINMCNSEIIDTPQYIILGYDNRIEIYSCLPEKN